MDIIMVIVFLIGSLAFFGQLIVTFKPKLGEKIGMIEKEDETHPVFYNFERGIARADIFLIWSAALAPILYFIENPNWPYFGIMGGTMLAYYSVLALFTRLAQKPGTMMGGNSYLRTVYINSAIWFIIGPTLVILSVMELKGGI